MPSCAAPCATKVATAKARTRIRSIPGLLVEKRNARLSSSLNAASGVIPARSSSGTASARMRPLGTAMMIGSVMSERGFTWGCSRAQQTRRSAERAGMSSEENNRGAFLIQEYYCRNMDAPAYARICTALAKGLNRDSAVGTRVIDWPGEPTRDALPLRLIGGLHALVLAGRDPDLAAVFAGEIIEPDAIESVLARTLIARDAELMPWLDGPPQTNEPGRCAALMTGLLEVARHHGPRIEIMEIGSSAGLNLMIDRYRFNLGGTMVGPKTAPIAIVPDWTGPPAPDIPIDIVAVRGCDIQPIDATDPIAEARLTAYVWAEKPDRIARLKTAITMLRNRPVKLERADAADWVEARLAEPQP